VVAALLVGCSLTYWLMRRSTPAAPSRTEIRSIAVLPFSDLSPRKDQEYFCDGMSDELINALTRVPGLGVAARTSSFQFRGQPHDVREIGRKLNVGALVEGSIRKAGNRLRMTVQLVSTADGYHLWSENYDRELGDILAVQEEISQAIVNALRIQLAANQPASLIKRYTDNTEAYLLYLRGRHFANKLTREGFTNAIRYFQQALEKDPTYALAYAGLADSYIFFYWRGVPQKEALAQTEQAVRKALELDDSLAEAHTSLGQLKVYRWDWESARREYRRAIELNPKYWRAHLGMSTELALLGNVDGAITEARRALEIEPLSPWINGNLGWLYYCSRQYDRAVEQLQKAIEVDKEFRMAHTWLAYCHLRTRKHEDAIAEARTSGREDHGIVAEAYALSGRSAEARMLLTKVPGRVPRARVYAALGNSDLALEELERLLQERSATLPWIRPDPAFESLRSDPRFTALLRRIGLEK
jgi:adenylate cyclase